MGNQFTQKIKLTNTSSQDEPHQNIKEDQSISPSPIDLTISRGSLKMKKISSSFAIDTLQNMERDALQIKQKHNRQYEDKELIEQCLLKHFFMCCLERQARLEIIKEMSLAYVPTNTTIFAQGTPGNYFYILKQGKVNLIINGEHKKTLQVGESFGELALLHGAPRSGTVIAETECYLWVLERKSFKKIVEHITKINFEENKTFIQSIPSLANIDHYQKAILCVSLIKENFSEGQCIVKAGDQSNCIYIVKEGEVNCVNEGKVIRTLRRGDNFGERSILIDSTRTMDVIAKNNCVCYSISVSTLKNMIGDNFRTMIYLNMIKSSFATSKYFKRFNPYLIDQILGLFEAVNYGPNSIVFPKGYNKSENIVVIIDGHLVNADTQEIVANRGSILFENELLNNTEEKINYDLVPCPDCLLIKANTKKVIEELGFSLSEIMEKSEISLSLSKVSIFKNLPRKKIEIITQKIGIETYKNGESIITEGETGDKFYIVKSGKVDISVKGKYIRTLGEKEYFGERALFFNEARSATATSKGDVQVFYISQQDFKSNIEDNMKEHLMNRLYLQDNTIELNDLEFVQSLGSGNYGNVSLVESKKNHFRYAIKAISRKQIDYEQLHQNLELEKSILLQIDHPFIVKLVKTLKDSKYIYFLMEYIRGKELFDVIRDIGLLTKELTQFYGGSLLLAIEYLHERKFIYRDLKPENVMVLYGNGYIKLIDFGTAKQISDRTSTIIGTPHYMAPEVILGGGYSFQVDIWSIAICMYEFMCGGVPFGESAEDPMEVYLAIINTKLQFPAFCKDKEFKQLMIHMLCKNPINRLTKINQIKNHVWFQNFNWEELMSLNMKPGYKVKENKSEKSNGNNEHLPYVDYAMNNYKEWEPSKEAKRKISEEKMKEFEKWYEKF